MNLAAQAPDWARVDLSMRKLDPQLEPARLPSSTKRRIVRYIDRHLPKDSGACISLPDGPGPAFSISPLGRPALYVVRAGAGCGGNVNAPGWLVRVKEGQPVVLADLFGWGFGVQPHESHGLPDFVVAWHLGFNDFTLTYRRFDGKRYRTIGHHEVVPCHADSDDPRDLCYREGGKPIDSTPPE